jgi:hypothetical protein
MGTSSHSLRLKRLEAYGAASKTEPLFFCLHEWADRTISQLAHDDPETIAREEAKRWIGYLRQARSRSAIVTGCGSLCG